MHRNLFISTLSCLAFNTAIAGLLTLVRFGGHFWDNLVFSQCIGLSIYAVFATVVCKVPNRNRWLILTFSLPASVIFGRSLGIWFTGLGSWSDSTAWVSVIIGLFFGGVGGIGYFLSDRIERLDREVRQHRLDLLESEKRQLEAHLKLLQAQIEPHFLFNTLANVGSLIDSDPVVARNLLDRLNDWLRVALARSRSDSATLGDELDMLENFLQIMKVRFGDRLRWHMEVGADERRRRFPPMLLQPLVENAVRHGIEPKVGGGEIVIRAGEAASAFTIEVSDSGEGLCGEAGFGTGLSNVSSRLEALYGATARLTLSDNKHGGVSATLHLPIHEAAA